MNNNYFIERNPRARFIPVEDVIDVYDEKIWWFYIPGYNGYELSNTNMVRSMKHFMKYPYGILIRPKTTKKSDPTDPSYELSNNNNERVTIRLSQLNYLAKTNPYAVYGYPRKTIWTDCASRNMRCFLKKSIPVVHLDETPKFPKFTIIDEVDPDDKFKIKMKEDVIVPIQSTDGSVYYGREDIKTIFH